MSASSQSSLPPCSGDPSSAVLVVEDDSLVRAYVRAVLESAGYRVLEAATGTEAIARFQSSHDDVSAVFLDLTLPQMAGLDVAAQLRCMKPDLPILLTSGHNDPRPPADIGASRILFLQKPFLPDQLVSHIHQAIAGCPNRHV